MNQLRKLLTLAAAAAALAVPASASAIGASLSIGGGAISNNGTSLKTAAELSPFVEFAILRLEVPVEYSLEPATSWAVRPGVKVFLPLVGLYARAGYGFGNLGGTGDTTQSLILGAGWQLSVLDTIGIFFEGTGEPSVADGGGFTGMARAGVMLNL